MPINLKVVAADKLVVATFEGAVTLDELVACFDKIMVEDGMPYRKLFDLTRGSLKLSEDDPMGLAARVTAYASVTALGPTAIVVSNESDEDFAQRFLNLTSDKRDARLFRSMVEARRWLVILPERR